MSNNINLDKTQPLKQIAREIFLRAISLIDPERLVADQIKRDGNYLSISDEQIDLAKFDRIIIIGFGKASLKMASGLRSILADHEIEGIVATNGLLGSVSITDLEVIVGGHP